MLNDKKLIEIANKDFTGLGLEGLIESTVQLGGGLFDSNLNNSSRNSSRKSEYVKKPRFYSLKYLIKKYFP
ncbi:MAG: hypothetical protein KC589_03060 [Nanoarchaeota archaeon]|nr:hypothetical protein [Nanoarchaeota archaeon]